METKTLKLLQLIAACTLLGLRLRHLTPGGRDENEFDVTDGIEMYILHQTYAGYVFILTLFTVSSLRSSPVEGRILKQFNLVGVFLYLFAEIILWTDKESMKARSAICAVSTAFLTVSMLMEALGII